MLLIWQVEPVPACDKKSFPLGQTHTSKTLCLVPEREAFPSGRRRSLIFLAAKLILREKGEEFQMYLIRSYHSYII